MNDLTSEKLFYLQYKRSIFSFNLFEEPSDPIKLDRLLLLLIGQLLINSISILLE